MMQGNQIHSRYKFCSSVSESVGIGISKTLLCLVSGHVVKIVFLIDML
jgi:hypothetical protein